MKYFYDESQRPQTDVVQFHRTPGYVEIQWHHTTPPLIGYAYVFPWQEHSLFVAAYLNRDEVFRILEQQLQDPTRGAAYYKSYQEAWPRMFELIDNTLNNQYSKGALLKIEDPDDGNRKWVVGTIVGNVIMNTGEELESLLRSERMAHAYELVWKLSDAIVTELSSRSPNRIKLFFRGAFAGLLSGHQQQINLTNVLVPKITEVFKIMKG